MKLTSVLMLALTATTVSDQEGPVAIACVGTSTATRDSGRVNRDNLPQQVFVFDALTQSVSRALEPRQEFEQVCGSRKGLRFVSISPGLVIARSDDPSDTDPMWTCKFEADRMAGTASYSLRGEWQDGRFHEISWDMKCRKAEVPVFDLSKRKF